jgi:hypothetical protein
MSEEELLCLWLATALFTFQAAIGAVLLLFRLDPIDSKGSLDVRTLTDLKDTQFPEKAAFRKRDGRDQGPSARSEQEVLQPTTKHRGDHI